MHHRLEFLDRMRGIVMVLMVTDHASAAFNAAHPHADSALLPGFDRPLDAGEFLVRWLSHLCAPVFVCLAGTSLALSVQRRQDRGDTNWSIDRDILLRGLLIVLAEVVFVNLFWEPSVLVLQVLYAIGLGMIVMVLLRRVADAWLLVGALAALVAGELLDTGNLLIRPGTLPAANALLFTGGLVPLRPLGFEVVLVLYPLVPWCAMMVLGWLLARLLLRRGVAGGAGSSEQGRRSVQQLLLFMGAGCLAIFVVLRWANGFGNLGLPRFDDSLVQWLHVSKYPPSLTFTALELGIMCLLLAVLLRLESSRRRAGCARSPLLVFGQTAFFFYLVHIAMLETAARAAGIYGRGDLGDALIASALVLLLLYPLCLLYRAWKARHPRSLLRFF